MFLTTKDFVNEQLKMLKQFDEYVPQMKTIEKANDVGAQLISHINKNVLLFDEKAFDSIDVDSIKKDLKININQKLNEEHLLDIYSEIEDSFELEGRVSLTEYLYQGNVIYTGMFNELVGNVDYSIAYSEEQLKKREREAAERYGMLLAFNNIVNNVDNIEFSTEGIRLVNKYIDYLDYVKFNRKNVLLDISDRLYEMSYTLLSLEVFNNLGCKPKNLINLNRNLSNNIKNILTEIHKYSNDANVMVDFGGLLSISHDLINKDSNFSEIYQEMYRKVELVSETIFENQKELNKNISL